MTTPFDNQFYNNNKMPTVFLFLSTLYNCFSVVKVQEIIKLCSGLQMAGFAFVQLLNFKKCLFTKTAS